MERVKVILKRIFVLPPLPTLLIAAVSFPAVIYVLASGKDGTAFACLAYTASGYALILVITGSFEIIRMIRRTADRNSLIRKVRNSSLYEKILKDRMFRAGISLYLGLAVNLLYIVLNFISGIRYRSVWFTTLSAYYLMLALMRFLLLRYMNRNELGKHLREEFRRYRLCGILLLLMNWVLAGVVVLIVHKNNGFEYSGNLIYAMALYAFYAVILAVINVIKFRKLGSPVISAAKVINFTAALVSMLSLETAMLAQFGGAKEVMFRRIMTGATGGVVCAAVLGAAIFMIVHATKQLKRLK